MAHSGFYGCCSRDPEPALNATWLLPNTQEAQLTDALVTRPLAVTCSACMPSRSSSMLLLSERFSSRSSSVFAWESSDTWPRCGVPRGGPALRRYNDGTVCTPVDRAQDTQDRDAEGRENTRLAECVQNTIIASERIFKNL